MAQFALTQVQVAVDEVNLTGFANQVDINAEADELDVTTFAGGGYRQRITGLGMFNVDVTGFQDFGTSTPGTSFPMTSLADGGTLHTFSVAPNGGTAGNTAILGQARGVNLQPLSGAVGDAAKFTLGLVGTSRLVQGQLLAPVAAQTSTGNGTVLAFTTPTASQSLHAAFHVHSVTGTGTITFVVATDDAVGFTTPVTRITSSAFAAVGHQFASLAGALAGETHIRLGWTISGFSSVTFSAAAGVGVA